MPAPHTFIEDISQRLDSFAARRRDEVAGLGDEAAMFVDHAAAALRGGKRLRARFCAAGWSAVARFDGAPGASDAGAVPTHAMPDPSGSAPPALVGVSAALEVFQAAALVHDDIIDNADTRRGRPSAHRALERAHRDSAWLGDADAFGRSAALLLGDLLVAWSDDLMEESLALAVDPEAPGTEATAVRATAAARAEYALMRREVTLGQFLDVAEESAWSGAPAADLPERALRIASYKSARYSVQQPLVIGAALAGADEKQLTALRDFGLPLGLAFQLRDDVLGVFGDATETGKPAGDDLREGKRTLLIALARPRLDDGERARFDALIGSPELDDDQIGMLTETIRSTGALDDVEGRIVAYTREAEQALLGALVDDSAVEELRDLARAATQRTH